MRKLKRQKTNKNKTVAINRPGLHTSEAFGIFSRAVGGATEIIRRKLTRYGYISSDAGGRINTIVNLDPSVASDWSSFSSLYDEWRLIGARIKFWAFQPNSVTAIASVLISVFDNDDASTALVNYSNGQDYQTHKEFNTIWNTGKPETLVGISNLPSNGGWASTGLPSSNPRSFKLYADTLTASTQYLTYTMELAVEFRGPT